VQENYLNTKHRYETSWVIKKGRGTETEDEKMQHESFELGEGGIKKPTKAVLYSAEGRRRSIQTSKELSKEREETSEGELKGCFLGKRPG